MGIKFGKRHEVLRLDKSVISGRLELIHHHKGDTNMIGTILTALVALIHFYIVYLEMVAWERPQGRKAFGTTQEFASATKVLAANQGLYNGFLAVGLLFALWQGERTMQLFLLACVAVAGLYGAMTFARKILFVQTVPAVLAIAAVLAGV
jgi:putative membrane protein